MFLFFVIIFFCLCFSIIVCLFLCVFYFVIRCPGLFCLRFFGSVCYFWREIKRKIECMREKKLFNAFADEQLLLELGSYCSSAFNISENGEAVVRCLSGIFYYICGFLYGLSFLMWVLLEANFLFFTFFMYTDKTFLFTGCPRAGVAQDQGFAGLSWGRSCLKYILNT